jgi:hypothetical protein
MQPSVEAGVIALVDRLQAVIKDIPAQYLDDVQQATKDLFQIRREQVEELVSKSSCIVHVCL